jgi:hypothetical protein
MKFGLKQNTIESISSVFEKYPHIEKVVIYDTEQKETIEMVQI